MQQISKDWWISLDESYRTRVDDGSLVLWRGGRTVWISIWGDTDGRTPRDRLAGWVGERDVAAVDLFQTEEGGLLRFGYLLEEAEDEGGRKLGLYSFTVGESSTVQMVCYFDLREDLGWATAVTKSLSYGRPDPAREVEEPLGENGHLALASDKVIGPDRAAVLFAYREPAANEEDSGWRFFHGDEDEAFSSDPANIALCPVSALLTLDPSLRVIINFPPGTAWERDDALAPWAPAGGLGEIRGDRPEWE